MTSLWQHDGFRRVLRVITAVWGAAFLAEAALRAVIVYRVPAGPALALSRVMPCIWVVIVAAWTVAYGRHQGKKGRRAMATAQRVSSADASR